MTHILRAEDLPELVRGSQLQVKFAKRGKDELTINTRTSRRRAEETWVSRGSLGQGGQGWVDLQARVGGEPGQPSMRAVKSIRVTASPSQSARALYQRELETIAKFSLASYSDSFITSYGWYIGNGCVHIAMEYCELGDLNSYLKNCQDGRLPEADTQHIAGQVLEALDSMHKENFCHRDLKPANILIKSKNPRWWVKLADFGLSRRDGLATTTRGGTPGYMPPEIEGFKVEGSKVDQYAVDMWCFGQVISRIVAGRVLFSRVGAELFHYAYGHSSFPEHVLRTYEVTNDLVGFVKSLTKVQPSERLSAKAALIHPWMAYQDYSPIPNAPSTEQGNVNGYETETQYTDDATAQWPTGFTALPAKMPQSKTETEYSDTQPKAKTSDSETTSLDLAESFKDLGNTLFKQSKYDGAIEQYTKAIQLSSNSAVYQSNRAAAYMADGQYEAALEDCLQALNLDPENNKIRLRLGRIYTRLGRPDDGLEVLQNIPDLATQKDIQRAEEMIAHIRAVEEAMNVSYDFGIIPNRIKEASRGLGPGVSTPIKWLLMVAEAYFRTSLHVSAQDTISSILKQDPENREALEFQDRIVSYLSTQGIFNPASAQPTETHSDSHTKVPQYIPNEQDAKATGERIVGLKTEGNAAYKRHDFEGALQLYASALAIDRGHKENAKVLHNMAKCRIKLREYNIAIIACRDALLLDPGYSKVRATRAIAYEMLGKTWEALQEWRELNAIEPHSSIDQRIQHLQFFLNYYEVLGVKTYSSPEEIRRAFFALNINDGDDAAFKAWETLSNPLQRQAYDTALIKNGVAPDPDQIYKEMTNYFKQ